VSHAQRPRKRDKLRKLLHLGSSRAVSPAPSTEYNSQLPLGSLSPRKMALNGAQLVLSGLAVCLDGVPIASNVVKAVNVLIEIANTVKDNNEDLSQLCDLVKSRLETVDSKLEATKVSSDLQSSAEAFAKLLGDKLDAMQDIRGRQTWKAVLQSSDNRAQIARFLKEIQEQTTTFQVLKTISSGCS